MNCTTTVEIGAYILGAISPEDRARIQTHLIDCRACEQELINLASLPGLLSRAAPDDIPNPGETDAPTPVTVPIRRRIKRRRKRQWVLATAMVIAGGTITGLWISGGVGTSHDGQRATLLTGTDPTSGLHVTVRLTPEQWGTQLSLQLQNQPRNALCQLVVHASDGREELGGSWSATSYSGVTDLPAATSISLADIASLDVVTSGGHRLIALATHG